MGCSNAKAELPCCSPSPATAFCPLDPLIFFPKTQERGGAPDALPNRCQSPTAAKHHRMGHGVIPSVPSRRPQTEAQGRGGSHGTVPPGRSRRLGEDPGTLYSSSAVAWPAASRSGPGSCSVQEGCPGFLRPKSLTEGKILVKMNAHTCVRPGCLP